MEILAYIDLTLASEAPASTTEILTLENLKPCHWFRRQTLSRYARMYLPSLFVLLSMFPMTGEAFVQILKEGSRGPLVTQVQQRLLALNYLNQQPTGYFGSKTKDAVMRFQGESGLNRDGVVGQATWTVLFGASLSNQNFSSYSNSSSSATNYSDNFPSYPYSPSPVTNYPLPSTTELDYSPPFSSSTDSFPPPTNSVRIPTSRFFPGQQPSNLPNPSPPDEVEQVYSGRILQRGARGEDVERLQQALRENGFNPGSINGIYEEDTENAVMEFQRLHNFPVDGVAGNETLKALGLMDGDVTSQSTSSYVVVIPMTTRDTLVQVQQILWNASEINSGQDKFVNAGVFPNRDTAENMSTCLRSHGFDARVAYLR